MVLPYVPKTQVLERKLLFRGTKEYNRLELSHAPLDDMYDFKMTVTGKLRSRYHNHGVAGSHLGREYIIIIMFSCTNINFQYYVSGSATRTLGSHCRRRLCGDARQTENVHKKTLKLSDRICTKIVNIQNLENTGNETMNIWGRKFMSILSNLSILTKFSKGHVSNLTDHLIQRRCGKTGLHHCGEAVIAAATVAGLRGCGLLVGEHVSGFMRVSLLLQFI